MLTDDANGPHAANASPSQAVMLTIGEIAARDGVSKPTVSIAVKRLFKRHGLQVQRDRQGRVARVNVVQYDRLRGEHGDLGRAQTSAAAGVRAAEADEGSSTDPVYTREQARNMAYTAELKRLEIEERLGRLVPIDRLQAEVLKVMMPFKMAIDRLERRAPEMAQAVRQGGDAGARTWLRTLTYEFSNEVAAGFATLAKELEAEPARLLSDFPDAPK